MEKIYIIRIYIYIDFCFANNIKTILKSPKLMSLIKSYIKFCFYIRKLSNNSIGMKKNEETFSIILKKF